MSMESRQAFVDSSLMLSYSVIGLRIGLSSTIACDCRLTSLMSCKVFPARPAHASPVFCRQHLHTVCMPSADKKPLWGP